MSYPKSVCFVFTVLLVCLPVSLSAFAQSEKKEKPKIKDFGSSLKNLNRNPKKNPIEGSPNKEKSDEEEVLRIKTTLVICDVLVTDKQGRTVKGLTRDDFQVIEDGVTQQIETFALGDADSIPRTIVLIFDYSPSQFPFIKNSVAAAKTLIDKLNPNDRMAIVTDDVELLVDFTRDKQELKDALDSLEKKTERQGFSNSSRQFGKSAQYSALLAVLNEAFDEEDERPIIIFQTDGDQLYFLRDLIYSPPIPNYDDPAQREAAEKSIAKTQEAYKKGMQPFSLSDIYQTAEKKRATIYTVYPGYRVIGLSPDEQIQLMRILQLKRFLAWNPSAELRRRQEERFSRLPPEAFMTSVHRYLQEQSALNGVSEITGGWTEFLETPEQAADIYSRILSDINRRYLLGYYPTNSEPDGKRRRIKIEVRNHPEYLVLGRKSYLPSDQ